MQRALSAAATGMEAQELRLSLIANNLANVNTTGFKKSHVVFQDLLYDTMQVAGSSSAEGAQVPVGVQVGQGVRAVATPKTFTMGDLKETGNVLDLAIEGTGFFQVVMPGGQIAYTRDGTWKTDAQGRVVTANGFLMDPPMVIPIDAKSVTVTADGTVSVRQGDQNQTTEVGRIQIAQFVNPSGLEAAGRNLYFPTSASGDPILYTPGTNGSGTIAQGFLEMSNVRAVEEMIDLIATQRAYELGTKVIQAADHMLATTSNIR
jgi:flagellar basal-body rod protein FlgG